MDGENVLVTAPSGAVLTLTPEGDALCARQQGAVLRFVRPEAAASVAIRTDAALEDFAGSWTAVSADMGGLEMSMDMLGMYMFADIEGQRHHLQDRRWRPRQRDAAFIRQRVHGRAGGRRADCKNGTRSDGLHTAWGRTGRAEDAGVTDQKAFRLREDGLMVMTWAMPGDLGMDVTFGRAA